MNEILTGCSALLITVIFFCFFMLARNEWVFKRRTELNRFDPDGVHIITEYLGYNEMMRRFWIWDVERLRK